jgi:hypothetical protein
LEDHTVKLREVAAAAVIVGALGYNAIGVAAPAAHADHPLWDCGGYPADICANFPWNAHAGTAFQWGGDDPPPPELNEGRFAGCDWNWYCIWHRIRGEHDL